MALTSRPAAARTPTRRGAHRTPERRGARRTPDGRGARRSAGWVPNQHGAWAMLIVPLVLGIGLRFQYQEPAGYVLALAPFWMVGYFTFHAASTWLKSRGNPRHLPPLLTYAAIATVLGLLTWAWAGTQMIWWAVPFAPILAIAMALAARRRERALVGGLLTVLAACLMVLVARYASPQELFTAVDSTGEAGAGATDALVLTAVAYAYFAGTVFFVKSMIRERGHSGFLALSVGWHLLALGVAVWASGQGWAHPGWSVFFGVAALRSFVLPMVGPMRDHGVRFTPQQLGIMEAVLSLILVLLALLTV